MTDKVYSLDELRQLIRPIAEKYKIPTVYIFGSYARGEATENSDVDIIVDLTGAEMNFPFAIGALYNDFEDSLKKEIDLVTERSLYQPTNMENSMIFRENVFRERVKLI
jgi:hypothetical protein